MRQNAQQPSKKRCLHSFHAGIFHKIPPVKTCKNLQTGSDFDHKIVIFCEKYVKLKVIQRDCEHKKSINKMN